MILHTRVNNAPSPRGEEPCHQHGATDFIEFLHPTSQVIHIPH
jgi:hypothetical protein